MIKSLIKIGITLLFLISGEYASLTNYFLTILHGISAPTKVKLLLNGMLQNDPNQRLSAEVLLKDTGRILGDIGWTPYMCYKDVESMENTL